MEAVMMHESNSPYKSHRQNPNKYNQNQMISNPSDAFWLSHFNSTGLMQPPPPAPVPFLSQSYPPYSLHKSSQPPLLPLPVAAPRRSAAARGLSCPPGNRKASFTSKKSKSPKKEDKNSPRRSKDVAKVVPLISTGIVNGGGLRSAVDAAPPPVDMFSGSAVFTTVSPPPSSLPLPTFSLRPKLGCKAEAAAGVDAGATNDLRRLLRLR